ncbi:hypothetical protein [Mesorhizobium sp. L103C105A0]|uniref:hypothetical protein n=1 Tax=unclassified Mesorhizobium TaxID=325217 RepID=UPI0003CFA2C3|nr:hypothetical protein [Mesorhizobium sp. L103C105A0]ESZ77678.1 hypothetical protein X726_10415 [Mesorhizobium sp. L103C105A0]
MNAISEPCQQQTRLTVRFAYQRGFQVLDGSAILQTFEKQDEAFKFVLGRGARVWLARSRTVIGRITDVACSP